MKTRNFLLTLEMEDDKVFNEVLFIQKVLQNIPNNICINMREIVEENKEVII
jgi:hypothetical protein